MRSLFCFIIEPKGNRTSSKKNINGVDLILNTELQNHLYVNRVGIVKAIPLAINTEIEVGDEIIVHHNVFRRFYDIKGVEKNSKAYYKDNMYLVQPDQIYAYNKNKEWKSIKGFCFIKPIKENKMFSINFEKEGIGIVKFTDGFIEKDSLVGFKPGFEYEFFIENQKLYRVPTNQITIKYEYQGNEEEYNPSWAQSG